MLDRVGCAVSVWKWPHTPHQSRRFNLKCIRTWMISSFIFLSHSMRRHTTSNGSIKFSRSIMNIVRWLCVCENDNNNNDARNFFLRKPCIYMLSVTVLAIIDQFSSDTKSSCLVISEHAMAASTLHSGYI